MLTGFFLFLPFGRGTRNKKLVSKLCKFEVSSCSPGKDPELITKLIQQPPCEACRMIQVGMGLGGGLQPQPQLQARSDVNPDQLVQGLIQLSHRSLQGWRLCSFSGQSFSCRSPSCDVRGKKALVYGEGITEMSQGASTDLPPGVPCLINSY